MLFNFIKLIFNDDDPHYIDEVTQAFMKLFEEEKDKQNVLYYIALCAVESHFKMSARSSAGAVGISQIMPSVWATTIRKNYRQRFTWSILTTRRNHVWLKSVKMADLLLRISLWVNINYSSGLATN